MNTHLSCPPEGTGHPRAPLEGEGSPSQRILSQSRFHLMPEADIRKHEFHPNCWCAPEETTLPGGERRIYVHVPLDGRGR